MDSYIFSGRCLKNHKIFIFHFLSNLKKNYENFHKSSQNILFVVYWTLQKNFIAVCQQIGRSCDYHFKTVDPLGDGGEGMGWGWKFFWG